MDSLIDDRESAPNDVLARSLSAIREENDVEGPTPEVHRHVLNALLRCVPVPQSPVSFLERTLHMIRVHKIAATLTLSTGGMMVWALLLLLSAGSGISYANVAEHIKSAQTIQYRMTTVINGKEAPFGSSTISIKEPGHARVDTAFGVMITDAVAGKILSWSPNPKTAHLVTVIGGLPEGGGSFDTAEGFKKLADAKGTPIADLKIGDVNAKGFEMQQDVQHISMWVDPKSGLPLRIESSASADGQEVKMVLTDLVFDRPLDDAIFSLTPPKGYTVETATVEAPAKVDPCEAVAGLLRVYAKRANGHFPKSLTDSADLVIVLTKDSNNAELDPKERQAISDAGILTSSLESHSKGKEYDYTPGDARLGDTAKIVFWTRGKDRQAYRAVFGDLSIRDATQAEISGH